MVGTLRLAWPSAASGDGRHSDVPPVTPPEDGVQLPLIALAVTLAAMLVPAAYLTSPTAIAATCAALLLGGLPHGALDLAVLRRDARSRTAQMIILYLGLAAMMFGTWQIAPSLALALFLAMAMVHFSEDWTATDHPFFALGIAVATLAAPSLLHHEQLAGLFVLIAGDPAAARLADALLLVAPIAAASASLAITLLWNTGQRLAAVNAACALVAMTALPPVTGFAIYFCLIHSPMHFRAGVNRLAPAVGVARSTIFATLGGLAIALTTLHFLPTADSSGGLFAASFMTLSILTLPHMLVPLMIRHPALSVLFWPPRQSAGSRRP